MMRKLFALLPLLFATAAFAQQKPNDRVLMLVATGVNFQEYQAPFLGLQAAGYKLDIASINKGRITLSLEGKEGPRDPVANLTLAEVKPEDYVGLVVPGGYSPGFLEKEPKAIEIATWFYKKDKPISTICHGPRLLMRASLLQDRVMTSLESVANELADDWRARKYGAYLDQPVVIDRNLLTSRYPNDAVPFTRATLEQLAKNGGLPLPAPASALVIAPSAAGGDVWTLREMPQVVNIKTRVVTKDTELADPTLDLKAFDALVILQTPAFETLKTSPDFQKITAAFAGKPSVTFNAPKDAPITQPQWAENLRALRLALDGVTKDRPTAAVEVAKPDVLIALANGFNDRAYAAVRLALELDNKNVQVVSTNEGWVRGRERLPVYATRAADAPSVQTFTVADDVTSNGAMPEQLKKMAEASKSAPVAISYTAAIALRDGFDDRVVAALTAYFRAQGRNVLYVATAKGPIKGVNGITLEADATYTDAKLSSNAIIVAPGGFAPQKKEARQAKQPDWIEDVAKADAARNAWLLERHKAGATLMLFGTDSLRLGVLPDFKGKKFSASDQHVWSFGKEGGSYTNDRATQTGERLITSKSADTIPDAVRLLNK